ncbi:chemotaxis protein CheR [Salipiger pallidus]|uniref:histidine kinase n=1 Tax=Salipiger pallidus TaxID=1775170 RepID=A0A8J3EI92_9RHOB|nr:chemotaxis protein CheB [Salipiger pallidus]GGG84298.1 chemotaxis protein CheR [Salipiger pallidus]
MNDDDQKTPTPERASDDNRLSIVGIGASAGGLEAIREMLSGAAPDNDLAYVVVQHLDPNHESLLAELLARQTSLNVRQVNGGETIEAGNVYIIPPAYGLSVKNGVLELTEFAQPRGLRRPIDDFFESLAVDQGRFAACVILSGTGADGSAGLRAIKEHGGLCIVQDPKTAKYDGMPLSARNTGLVDFVRRPSEIVETITQFYAHSLQHTVDAQIANSVSDTLPDICSVVRNFVGHDFSGYKTSTLIRRVQRRIQVLDMADASAYLQHLRSDPQECELLFRDLLINVTRFFRDSEHFETLRQVCVQPLIRDARDDDEIRVWIPGCSSGEEAYSLAMLFAEEARIQKRSVNIQIFATDIDEQMLRIAREGTYPQAALADIPEGMRDLYSVARDGRFQIVSRIRDMIRFSLHSVVRDPPFSNIDLVSCRNLLIYFGDRLQATALPIFHYAIKPRGILFLGPSETVGRYDHVFSPIDQQARIFRRNEGRPEYPVHLRGKDSNQSGPRRRPATDSAPSTRLDWNDDDSIDRLTEKYAPPTMRVSAAGEILKTGGRLGKYFDFSGNSETNRFAPSTARPGVREAVSAIIRQGARQKRRIVSRDLVAQSEFGEQPFELIAEPVGDGTILLIFRERSRFEPLDEDEFEELDPMDGHVQSLEDELRSTRIRLHTTVEELETANEELKSSNEEMMSMNEELQSTNEELSTVNDELKSKVDELSVANSDLSNFFASTALPLVVVDETMEIRNFTDAITAIYPFRVSDRGRPLTEVTSTLRENEAVLDATQDVIADGEPRHLRVGDREGQRTWSLVVTAYRTRDGVQSGATLVFTEITNALRLEEALRHEGERLRLALDVSGLGVWECDPDTKTMRVDKPGSAILRQGEGSLALRRFIRTVTLEDREGVETALNAAMDDGRPLDLTFRLSGSGPRFTHVRLVGHRVSGQGNTRLLGVIFDVTNEQEARSIREMMLREMNHRMKNMFSIISGLVRLAGRNTDDVSELVDNIQARISALARSHDLTQRGPHTEGLPFKEVVGVALQPYENARSDIRYEGPSLRVSREDLTAMSLLLHEWATNAAKYGVLNASGGRLEVTWKEQQNGEIVLEWNEYHSDTVEVQQDGSGFGSTLIQLSASQLNGRVQTEVSGNLRKMVLVYEPQERA